MTQPDGEESAEATTERNFVAEGEDVLYHGSLSDHHGTWTFMGYCCDKCMPVGDELAEARFVLYRFADGEPKEKLEHVSRSSFTALTVHLDHET